MAPTVNPALLPKTGFSELVYGSVCSGIEAATVAWERLGWRAAFYSEIEHFPQAVLRHHYGSNIVSRSRKRKSLQRKPGGIRNFGDFTTIRPRTLRRLGIEPINVLVGGTPCQSFSVAGLRGGMDDARGNLALEYIRLAYSLSPDWFLWENVPGVFSSTGGEDFRSILSAAAGWEIDIPQGGWQNSGIITPAPGCFGVAWRVLDTQYVRVDGFPCAIPQRRRRVFVVGYLGDWRPAAAVLFEQESLSGNFAPRRQSGQDVAGTLDAGIGRRRGSGMNPNQIAAVAPTIPNRGGGGGLGTDFDCDGGLVVDQPFDVANTLTERMHKGVNSTLDEGQTPVISSADHAPALTGNSYGDHESRDGLLVAHTLRGEGFDAMEDGTGRGTPIIPVAIQERAISENPDTGPQGKGWQEGLAYTLEARNEVQAVAFSAKDHGADASEEVSPTLRAMAEGSSHANGGGQVAVAFHNRQDPDISGDVSHPIGSKDNGLAVAIRGRDDGAIAELGEDVGHALRASQGGGDKPHVLVDMSVRRLTPRECERLQGIPDDYTLIPDTKRNWKAEEEEMREYFRRTMQEFPGEEEWRYLAADGPRYKSLGNSYSGNSLTWLALRIGTVDAILKAAA